MFINQNDKTHLIATSVDITVEVMEANISPQKTPQRKETKKQEWRRYAVSNNI